MGKIFLLKKMRMSLGADLQYSRNTRRKRESSLGAPCGTENLRRPYHNCRFTVLGLRTARPVHQSPLMREERHVGS